MGAFACSASATGCSKNQLSSPRKQEKRRERQKASYFRQACRYQAASFCKAASQKASISSMTEFVGVLRGKVDSSPVCLACQDNQRLSRKFHRILLSSHADNVTLNLICPVRCVCVPFHSIGAPKPCSAAFRQTKRVTVQSRRKKCARMADTRFELIWLGGMSTAMSEVLHI